MEIEGRRMSSHDSPRPTPLQLARHKQRQKKALTLLQTICPSESIVSMSEEQSVQLELRIIEEAKTARQSGAMRVSRCSNASDALSVLRDLQLWSAEMRGAMDIFLPDGMGTGFVEGIVSATCLQRLLENSVDGVAIVDPTNSRAFLVDVVVDDPIEGSFIEIEAWDR
jgi:hypothetical protein